MNFFKSMKANHINNTKGWNAKNVENTEPQAGIVTKTYNLIIVDESGSMLSIFDSALSGMNETLQTIREAAKEHPDQQQFVTLVTFDTGHYKEHYRMTQAKYTKDLTAQQYSPCGGTPLFDALGRALLTLDAEIEQGDNVLVTIITDGYENASCEYSGADIKAIIERLSHKGWLFTYIGANQDAMDFGMKISIKNNLNFEATMEGTKAMFAKEMKARKAYYQKRSEEPEAMCNEMDYFKD